MNHGRSRIEPESSSSKDRSSEDVGRLAPTHEASHRESGEAGRSSGAWSAEVVRGRQGGTALADDGHHPPGRPPPRLSREGLIAADQLVRGFQVGDATLAYEAGVVLAEAYRTLWIEAAQLRFQQNFGGPVCQDCDGLKAGPGVIATCFQLRQCNYESIKEGDETPRQRVLQSLLGDRPPK